MPCKVRPLGVFEVAPFHHQVAVFDDIHRLQKYHTKVLGKREIQNLNPASYGMCIMEFDDEGVV